MEQLFENILDKDEKISKVIKPNKLKLFWSAFFGFLFFTMWFLIPIIAGVLASDSNLNTGEILLSIGITVGVWIALFIIVLLFVRIYYKNVYYAYSNKRIILRSGIFGIDYKSLDMSMIGAVNVYVSLLDKLLRKNTGTISFGSMASPFMSGNSSMSSFRYANIQNPYDLYKEVKSAIDEYKSIKPSQK